MIRLVDTLFNDSKSGKRSVSNKSMEKFKEECVLSNNDAEVSLVRLASNSRSRHCFVRLGNCSESPNKVCSKHTKSNDEGTGPSKTTGRRRKRVKLIVKEMKKFLDQNSTNEIMTTDMNKMQKKKEELVEDSMSSSDDSELEECSKQDTKIKEEVVELSHEKIKSKEK